MLYETPDRPRQPGIADTSDSNWTPEMQRAWPHFIQGVSRLWLELIREIGAGGEWPDDLEARYAAIGEELDGLWRHQGGHALLHHLGVFGYREVAIIWRVPNTAPSNRFTPTRHPHRGSGNGSVCRPGMARG